MSLPILLTLVLRIEPAVNRTIVARVNLCRVSGCYEVAYVSFVYRVIGEWINVVSSLLLDVVLHNIQRLGVLAMTARPVVCG